MQSNSLTIRLRSNYGKIFAAKYVKYFSSSCRHRRTFRNPASGHRFRYRRCKNSEIRRIQPKIERIIRILWVFIQNDKEENDAEEEVDASSGHLEITLKT